MNVVVTEYNPAWPRLFEEEAKHIKAVLGGNLVQIFHIGSTAVPGLAAKPVIDIMPVVFDIEKTDLCQRQFETLGYGYMGEFGIPGRRYLRKGGNHRTHHLHVFQYDNTQDILRHLALRNYLRSHPTAQDAYGQLKIELAAKYPSNIEGYCDSKDSFVKQAEHIALQWFWDTCGG